MEKLDNKYFLGANSCEGFISVFDKCYSPEDNWIVYIIKGGPGTGKSSFMKKFASRPELKDTKVLLCPCSSDPYSLDAVIIPDKKIVIMDGTAPHTVDPMFPGVCEKILNFSEFWDNTKLEKNRQNIIETTLYNKSLHRSASQYMKAVGILLKDNYKTSLACTDQSKALNFSQKICRKMIPQVRGKSKEWIRFISGITPEGIISFPETILNQYKNVIIIKDDFGSASNIIINNIRDYALNQGHEIICLKSPFLPSVITDHILIPDLSLAICTENKYITFNSDSRRIHSRRFISTKQLHYSNERIKFNNKAIKQLLVSASGTLENAKSVHDKIESYYINAMDFSALNEYFNKFCSQALLK